MTAGSVNVRKNTMLMSMQTEKEVLVPNHGIIPGRLVVLAGTVLVVLLSLIPRVEAAEGEGRLVLLKEETVLPGAAYRLSFDVEKVATEVPWIVHLRDSRGNLPYDGVLDGDWQKIFPGKTQYTHVFRTPPNSAQLRLFAKGAGVEAKNVRLEKLDAEGLVLNGGFVEGPGNFSGWSENYHVEFVEVDGATALRVNQNGYALTDFAPVVGGGSYVLKSQQGVPGLRILVYDAFRRFLSVVEREKDGSFIVPKGGAYVRALYATGHQHLPAWTVNEIKNVALEPLDVPEPANEETPVCEDWEIVLSPGSDPREEFAARELRHWMKEITGKAPALLAEPSGGRAQKIFVGRESAGAFAEDLRKLEGSDGYAVREKDGAIHVFGAKPRGTVFGVHALLEKNTDIIWPRPNPDFEAMFSKVPRIEFSNRDFLSRPEFQGRHISGGYTPRDTHVFQGWQARNGLNTPWRLHVGNNYLAWLRGAKLGYGGSHITWLKDTKDEDENVLPLIDGKRVDSRWRQPCYTYHKTPKAIAENIRQALQTLPGREIEHVSSIIADNWTVCGCPECLAPIVLPNGEKLETNTTDATKNPLFFSTRNFLMLNQVAEELAGDFPDLRLQTHAYIFTAEPPKVAIHPAIIPEFAAYPTQNVRYPILAGQGNVIGGYDKLIWKRRFEQWGREKKGGLGYFGYYYTEGFNAVADTAAADYRALADYDAVQVHTESFPVDGEELSAWDADGMEKWVIAKLMWDPSQDPEVLRGEFIRRVYPGAEKEMAAFYKLIRDSWHGAPESVFVNCHSAASDLFQKLIVDPGLEDKARTQLEAAERAAKHPKAKAIIRRHLAYFQKLGDTLGRVRIPLVDESKNEWMEPTSPHWEKAVVIKDFKQVSDWRLLGREHPSRHPSVVRLMRDQDHLYVRFDGKDSDPGTLVQPEVPAGMVFPNGDRFEVRLRNAQNRDFFLAVGPGNHVYSQPPLGGRIKSVVAKEPDGWTAILSIPLNVFGTTAEDRQAVKARLGRVYRLQGHHKEESTPNGAGLFNDHSSFWLDFQLP